MTTFSTICRHSIFNASPRLFLVTLSASGRITTTTTLSVPTSIIKHSKLISQYYSSCLPSIQSANISTSSGTLQKLGDVTKQDDNTDNKEPKDKMGDRFASYEKAAKTESFHFEKHFKHPEEKGKEIVPVDSDPAKSQGAIF